MLSYSWYPTWTTWNVWPWRWIGWAFSHTNCWKHHLNSFIAKNIYDMDTNTRGCKRIAVSRKVARYVLSFKLTILHLGTKRGGGDMKLRPFNWLTTVLRDYNSSTSKSVRKCSKMFFLCLFTVCLIFYRSVCNRWIIKRQQMTKMNYRVPKKGLETSKLNHVFLKSTLMAQP